MLGPLKFNMSQCAYECGKAKGKASYAVIKKFHHDFYPKRTYSTLQVGFSNLS